MESACQIWPEDSDRNAMERRKFSAKLCVLALPQLGMFPWADAIRADYQDSTDRWALCDW